MQLALAQRLAEGYMRHYLPASEGWTFAYSRSVRQFGSTEWRMLAGAVIGRKISLSAPLTEKNTQETVTDTILHEIAHALAGHSAGHGPVWQKKARELGCKAERCVSAADVETVKRQWKGVCPVCKRVALRHRRNYKACCGKCRVPVEWSAV